MPSPLNLDTLEALLGAPSLEELHTVCKRIANEMGYEHFLYGVRVDLSPTRPYQFIFSGFPRHWREHYEAQEYQRIDPTVEHCAQKVIPVVWNSQLFHSKEQTTMADEARASGLVSGVSLPIHGRASEVGMLSLVTERTPENAKNDILANLGQAQLFTCYLHEAIRRLVLEREVIALGKTTLTAREKECLLWAAEGKTAWEIGQILNISERTIVFHLSNAGEKLGATNRRQAVARAIALGLIKK